MFIFDWDDTLLCTSFLSALHFLDLSPEIKEMLTKLDETCVKLLTMTSDRGDVYIITNATKGWVEYSSKLYISNNPVICPTLTSSWRRGPSPSSQLARSTGRTTPEITGAGRLRPSRASSRNWTQTYE